MAIVSFWSDGTKETGKTSSMAAISTLMSIDYNYKILLFNTEYNDTTLEDCFWKQEKTNKLNFTLQSKIDLDTGISGVIKAVSSNKISPEIITNYTRTVFKDALELLTEEKIYKEDYEKQRINFKEIIKIANKYYDLVFVDLSGNINDSIVNDILDISNLIIVNLPSNLRKINEYKKIRMKQLFANKNNVLVLLGKCDKKSKYNEKNVSRYLQEKELVSIQYNTQFFESATEGKVAEYFIKFRAKSHPDNNTDFIGDIKRVSSRIIQKLQDTQMKL